ncbi:MAG: hypothetical protein H8E21_03205 [Gammaproteobacteria bacterium]|nr:hypothetical protein [Gammaproteobacteria bacterium]
MARKKLLKRLADFFDMDVRAREQRKEELSELLTRLKQKEVSLKEELEQEKKENAIKKLEQKIDVVHTQRKKGVKILLELRNELEGKAS